MHRIAIGSDHRGYELKQVLQKIMVFGDHPVTWHDVGTDSAERTDYPIYTKRVVDLVRNGTVTSGIMICGSGIGASIAANRYAGIFAGLVWQEQLARVAKEDDNVNLLVLPADYISEEDAQSCIAAWLSAEFKQGRYLERLQMLEKREEP